MIGTLLSNRYRIDAQLGEGGMGVVYKAHDTLLDRPVAIKVLSSHLSTDGAERLLREARSVAQLDHPHIVSVYDAGEVNGQPFIAMQMVSGKSLREAQVSLEQAVEYAKQVCLALDHAHGKGIIHRDIKPENIMVTDSATVKVMDFGLARSEGRSRLTQTGLIVGTVAYMAPEQVLGGEANERSDLYSLGCVLYELVAGRPPFTGADPISVISQHLQVPPVAPHWYKPQVSPELEGIILKLMAKDPVERYTSAKDVLGALDQLTASATFAAATETPPISPALLLGIVLRTRMVGRDGELRELKSSLELAASGHGQVILIEGEPGVGKTRLLQETQVYARLRGFIALVGRCYEQETGIPYLPFIEVFQSRFRGMDRPELLDELGAAAPEFVKLIPEVRRTLPDVEPSPPLEAVQERLRLFASVAEYLTSLSRRTPLVVILEDIHWADAASLNLLQHLARTLHGERVAILGSYRDVEVDRKHPLGDTLREMNRDRLFNRVSLRRLKKEGVAAMVQTMLEVERTSEEFVDLVYGETEGNPFFVEEVLKSLVEEGAIYREDGSWQLKEISEIAVPQSVREVVGRRLERVSEPCQQVLSLAAIIGRRFRFEILQTVGELPEEELLGALEEAMRAQLVREESEAGEVEYDFVHALIREVLYERLSLRRRMTLHQKVGETLERQHAGRTDTIAEDLAHHFTRAPHGVGLEKAIQYSIDAAGKSMRLFAYEEAVRFYQNAVELLGEIADEERLTETYIALAEPFIYLGNTNASTSAYEHALKFYQRLGNAGEVARIESLIGRVLGRHRRFTEAIPYLKRALEGLSPVGNSEDLIRTYLDLGRALYFPGEHDEAETYLQQGLALATEQGNLLMQADAHTSLGLLARRKGEHDRAYSHHAQSITLARSSHDPQAQYILIRGLNNISFEHIERGEWDQAVTAMREALDVSRRIRDIELIATHHVRLANHYFLEGQWPAAKEQANGALELALVSPSVEDCRSLLHWMEEDLDRSIAIMRDRFGDVQRTGDVQGVFFIGARLIWAHLEQGNVAEAVRVAQVAAEAEETQGLFLGFLPAFVTEALARSGHHERCAALCSRGEEVSRAAGSARGFTGVRTGRAILDLEQGNFDDAIRRLDEVLAVLHFPMYRVYAMQKLGWALARRGREGDLQRARQILADCLDRAEKIGDRRKAAQIRGELASLPPS